MGHPRLRVRRLQSETRRFVGPVPGSPVVAHGSIHIVPLATASTRGAVRSQSRDLAGTNDVPDGLPRSGRGARRASYRCPGRRGGRSRCPVQYLTLHPIRCPVRFPVRCPTPCAVRCPVRWRAQGASPRGAAGPGAAPCRRTRRSPRRPEDARPPTTRGWSRPVRR
ncbi:hypothetical protein STXM2123_2788 [Streptomyces sp. F-3]|nr:hypothetical protein STXM2123_2788 [Streptomyces sp. F-3]